MKSKHTSIHTKKNSSRPSPSESATSLPEGAIRRGGNGHMWVIKKSSNGIRRWIPVESCTLNRWQLLTVDILAKNIGNEIEVFEREYMDTWPAKNDGIPMGGYLFTPSGHIQINHKKKIIENWLKTRKPAIKKGIMVSVLGVNDMGEDWPLQVDSSTGTLASTNIMNREAFIRI